MQPMLSGSTSSPNTFPRRAGLIASRLAHGILLHSPSSMRARQDGSQAPTCRAPIQWARVGAPTFSMGAGFHTSRAPTFSNQLTPNRRA